MCRPFAALLLNLLIVGPLTCSAGPAPAGAIPLALDMDGRITVRVRVDGAGPFRFRVDTGASRTVVATRIVRELVRIGRTRVVTQAGESTADLVALRLQLEGQGPGDVVVAAALDGRLIDASGRLDGVVGQDVLARGPFTIDYRERQLVPGDLLSDGRPGIVRLPLVRTAAGLMAIVAQRDGAVLRLVPDTGADRLVLFRSMANRVAMTRVGVARVRSLTGERHAARVRVDDLRAAALRLDGIEAVLLEGDPGRLMGDGLLPLHLFARAAFDIGQSTLRLEPR